MKGKKGQATAEFYVLLITVIMVFVFFLGVSNQVSSTSNQLVESDKASYVATSIADAVNAVFESGNSTTIEITIPQGYNISYQPRAIVAVDENGNWGSAAVLTGDVNVSVASNVSIIIIRNEEGEVFVSD